MQDNLPFFRLRVATNQYSEVHSTKYRPISIMDHFSSSSTKIGNRFQPTACQGCERKAFTIGSAEKHNHWNAASSATIMKTSIATVSITSTTKIKPCIYDICSSPNSLAQQMLCSNSLRSMLRVTHVPPGRAGYPHLFWVRIRISYQKHYQHLNPSQGWCRLDLHILVCLLKCSPLDTTRRSGLNS